MFVPNIFFWVNCLFVMMTGGNDQRCFGQNLVIPIGSKYSSPAAKLPECNVTPSPNGVSSDVNRLTLGDIKVLAAMGDSTTAAMFARSSSIIPLYEYRDVSFSSGSATDVFTIGTMLRRFSPQLVSHSSENKPALNVAISGAWTKKMPEEAKQLIANMKQRSEINIESDWKMITLLAGNNDICFMCRYNKNLDEAVAYMVNNVRMALDELKLHLPRTIVNIIPSLDFETSYGVKRNFICGIIFQMVCPCVNREQSREKVLEFQAKYFQQLEKLAAEEQYNKDSDFQVIFQPFSRHIKMPKNPHTGATDAKYYAPDCFHPSYLAQERMAKMLWNNLLTPVGQKSTDGSDIDVELKCPDPATPFIPTNKNTHLWT